MGAKGGKRSKGGKGVLGWPPYVVVASCRGEGEGRERRGGKGVKAFLYYVSGSPPPAGARGSKQVA